MKKNKGLELLKAAAISAENNGNNRRAGNLSQAYYTLLKRPFKSKLRALVLDRYIGVVLAGQIEPHLIDDKGDTGPNCIKVADLGKAIAGGATTASYMVDLGDDLAPEYHIEAAATLAAKLEQNLIEGVIYDLYAY